MSYLGRVSAGREGYNHAIVCRRSTREVRMAHNIVGVRKEVNKLICREGE